MVRKTSCGFALYLVVFLYIFRFYNGIGFIWGVELISPPKGVAHGCAYMYNQTSSYSHLCVTLSTLNKFVATVLLYLPPSILSRLYIFICMDVCCFIVFFREVRLHTHAFGLNFRGFRLLKTIIILKV